MQTLKDFLSAEDLQALKRPTAQALGLPGSTYSDPGFLELERHTLFRGTWVAAAVASQLPNPGDVLPVDVAGWPLVLVRNRVGDINAFHNICRHRNAAVVSAPAHHLPALRCPWHGWTYDLEGMLRGSPEFGGVGIHQTEPLQRARLNLLPVRCAQWFDVVFVNIDGRACALESHLGGFRQRFESVRFDALSRAHSWETTYPCNWKLAVESGIEDYHLPFLHPDLTNGAKRGDRTVMDTDNEVYFACGEVSRSQWANGRGASDLTRLPNIPGLRGDDAHTLFFLNLFPSAVIGMVPDSLYIGIWLPDGCDKTSLTFHHYFANEGATEPRYAATRESIVSGIKKVFAQDVPVVDSVQRRSGSRDYLDIRSHFSPFWETLVHGFQKMVISHIENGEQPQ